MHWGEDWKTCTTKTNEESDVEGGEQEFEANDEPDEEEDEGYIRKDECKRETCAGSNEREEND